MDNSTIRKRDDGKLVEMFDHEVAEFEAGRLRIHRQPPCRFENCRQEWYLSDSKQAFHDRKMKEVGGSWKMPTSCPDHRPISKIAGIMANNTEKCPVTGKQTFNTYEAAVAFISATANANGGLMRIYPCNDCHGFHLTSMPPEKHAEMLRKKNGNGVVPPPPPPSPPPAIDQKEKQVCDMYLLDVTLTIADVARALGLNYQVTRNILLRRGVQIHSGYRAGSRAAGGKTSTPAPLGPPPPKPIPPNPADLDAEEEQLQARLEAIKRKKQQLAEARRLKVEIVSPHAFRIAEEGEQAILPMAELEQIISHLMTLYHDYVKEKQRESGEHHDPNVIVGKVISKWYRDKKENRTGEQPGEMESGAAGLIP